MTRPDPLKAHGLSGYTNRHCRCEICRAAQNAYIKAWRRRQPGYAERQARFAQSRAERQAAAERGAERRAIAKSKWICPNCGGKKYPRAVVCRGCYIARLAPKTRNETRPYRVNLTPGERVLAYRRYMREYMRVYRASKRTAPMQEAV